MELRGYQKQAIKSVKRDWSEGHRNMLLVLPTGTGKTVIFSSIAKDCADARGRVLILAHRDELIRQAADKIEKIASVKCGIEKAEEYSSGESIVVGSVQTLINENRTERLKGITHIIVDEAHHALASSYKKVIGAFSDAKILGVTATPDRMDKKNLGEVFEKVSFEYSLLDAVKEGYLCKMIAKQIPLRIDLGKLKTTCGDYQLNEVGERLDPYLEEISEVMATECVGRKTVVFLPLVETSQKFCEMLNNAGIPACEVNGKSIDRKEKIEAFECREYKVLCNSMLLTEGWDCPSVDCIVVLRPTKSRALYAQMIGRGTRPYEGKENLLILDFMWLTEDHSLIKPAHLVAPSKEIADKMIAKEEVCEQIDLLESLELAENEVVKEREATVAKRLEEQRRNKKKLVDPLQYEFSIAAEDLINYEPINMWEMAPASEKQLSFIEKRGISPESIDCCGKASLIIDKLIKRQDAGLSTPKQIRFLENKKFRNVGSWKFEEANAMIVRIKENGWKVPYWFDASGYVPPSLSMQLSKEAS